MLLVPVAGLTPAVGTLRLSTSSSLRDEWVNVGLVIIFTDQQNLSQAKQGCTRAACGRSVHSRKGSVGSIRV